MQIVISIIVIQTAVFNSYYTYTYRHKIDVIQQTYSRCSANSWVQQLFHFFMLCLKHRFMWKWKRLFDVQRISNWQEKISAEIQSKLKSKMQFLQSRLIFWLEPTVNIYLSYLLHKITVIDEWNYANLRSNTR